MKIIVFVFFSFFILSFQVYDLKMVNKIEIKADFFITDNLGNAYLIVGDELLKYDNAGNLSGKYSNKSLGKISFVDAGNPLNILLFYKDFSKILFLDNMLGEKGNPIKLQNYELEQASLVSASHNNGIWVYDRANFQLIRLDQQLKTVQQTGNLPQILGINLNPNFFMEYNNWLYLNNPETGILVFDIYGTYYKTIPVKNLKSFQVIDNTIFYYKENEFRSYHLKTMEESKIELPEQLPLNVRIEKNRLYILQPEHFSIYSLK